MNLMHILMTLEQKVGQSFFPAVFINDTEENIIAVENLIKKHNIGGLTFFHSRASAATNYESKVKVVWNEDSFCKLKKLILRYQACASTPLLMSIDAEWGLAMRIENTPQLPYAITLGAMPESQIDLVYQTGKQIGLDLRAAGIHYNLAPVADINTNPNNPVIGYRSFGENKQKAAYFATAYIKGLNEVGVLGCLKHFPGHGNTCIDSHLDLPVLEENLEQLLANELVPFIEGIKQGVDSIMIGHLAVPHLHKGQNTSATLSEYVIKDLLRKQLGYDGLVISDALNMRSVSDLYNQKGQLEWEAFQAGNDVLCFAENIPEGIREILKNASPERIEASFERIRTCKEKAGILQNWQPTGNLNFDSAFVLNKKIAQQCITKIKEKQNTHLLLEAHNQLKLAKISFFKPTTTVFFKHLNTVWTGPEFAVNTTETLEISTLEKELEKYTTLLLALYIPSAKPIGNFGMNSAVLDLLGKLLANKKVVLYVFGNPYALAVVPNFDLAQEIVLVYQDFDSFQEQAAKQLLQNLDCPGNLPVTIFN